MKTLAEMLAELQALGDEIAAERYHWWTPHRKELESLQRALLTQNARLQRIVKSMIDGGVT